MARRQWLGWAFRLVALWISLASVMFVLEVALRTIPSLQELDSPMPIYFPAYLTELDQDITRAQHAVASVHPLGFNDVIYPQAKPPGEFRIALVGDSFVGGDGLADDSMRWGRKLEARMNARYENAKILQWGQDGWSTKDQLAHLKAHVSDYGIDAIVIGWVINDPDLDRFKQQYLPTRKVLKALQYKRLFPEATKWVTDYLGNVIHPWLGWGYGLWEQRLFEPENLAEYELLLRELDALLVEKGVPYVVALTPSDGGTRHDALYAKVKPIFARLGIETLDLLPAIRASLGGEPSRAYWANLVDPHPGDPVTEVYAEEVAKMLYVACSASAGQLRGCDFDSKRRSMWAAE